MEQMAADNIENKIFLIRGQRVMLDSDLAELYEVKTKALKQAVKRNIGRFPDDFMFELSSAERDELVTICDRLHKTLKHSSVNSMLNPKAKKKSQIGFKFDE